MKKIILGAVIAFSMAVAVPPPVYAATSPAVRAGYQPLAKPGEKILLDAGHYFIYGFDKPAKLGMAIMRVEIFTLGGKRDTSFSVKGDADMPSMRGAHANGDKEFALSNKGVYLLPVRLVMPGDWEITFTFLKQGKAVFRGAYLFDL